MDPRVVPRSKSSKHKTKCLELILNALICNLVKEVMVKTGVRKKNPKQLTQLARIYLFRVWGKSWDLSTKRKRKKEMSDFRRKHIFTENIFKCCFETNVFA